MRRYSYKVPSAEIPKRLAKSCASEVSSRHDKGWHALLSESIGKEGAFALLLIKLVLCV
jgi:hypothetical protein